MQAQQQQLWAPASNAQQQVGNISNLNLHILTIPCKIVLCRPAKLQPCPCMCDCLLLCGYVVYALCGCHHQVIAF